MRLPFDPDDPPAEPPPGCPLPTIWRLAYALHERHRPADDGICACGVRYPCASRRASLRAFLEACGVPVRVPPSDLFDLWHGILLVDPATRPDGPSASPHGAGPQNLDG
ncbi:hypothetical protein [Plantactinospora alkalitolerans]|uniref:hypothetical protein n=1 Tax=Plantactinospora alkalitolerans TaxID=2789879 RepID=UPI001E31C8DA|nr:hypothetical protein [Plantactinospora alkalitolerans]